jgi:hypothetical protein
LSETESSEDARIETIIIERKAEQEDPEGKEYKDRMVIRSFSSMIMLIPSFVIALVCFLTQMIRNDNKIFVPQDLWDYITAQNSYINILGIIFTCVFVLNIILIAFDFNRSGTIIIIVSVIAIIAILLLVNVRTQFIQKIIANFPDINIYYSTQAYFIFTLLFFFILLFTWLKTLFNYYIIEGNELIHHKGLGGGIERYPATNMSVVKEFPDIIEMLIYRSGTLVLTPPKAERAIVLKNVIGITKKVKTMNEILSRLKVDID